MHPLELVTVTEYVPVADTVIDCVVEPLLHVFPLAKLEVSTTFPPWQNVVGPPAAIVGIGLLFTVTVVLADVPVHPLASVVVTE